MQENGEFFAIFSLEDARVASYSLRAPHNATSVIGDPAEVRGKNICQTTGKGKTGGGERYQQHKQHKPTTIARATTQHALEGFTCGRKRKARLVAGNSTRRTTAEN